MVYLFVSYEQSCPNSVSEFSLSHKQNMAPTSLTRDLKRKRGEDDDQVEEKKSSYKQRVLVLSSRGITQRQRHLMNDLSGLLPHSKKGTSNTRYC